MSTCNYNDNGICGLPTNNSDNCYVHNMLLNDKPISDFNEFILFLNKHRSFKHLLINDNDYVIINFEWIMSRITGLAQINTHEPIILKNIIFNNIANFSKFKTMGEFYMINCIFNNDALFNEMQFKDQSTSNFRIQRHDVVLEHSFVEVSFNKEADFRNSAFNNCSFKEVDFSKCFFTGAKFHNCSFVNCQWAKKGFFTTRRGVLYDELNFYKENRCKTSYSDLEKVYRNLKAIAKSCEDRWMEGEFHYSENEIIMRRTKCYQWKGISSRAYYHASRFGEKPSRALLNAIIIVAIWMLLYAYNGIEFYSYNNTRQTIDYDLSFDFYFNLSHIGYLLSYALYPISLNKLVGPSNIGTYLLSILESALLVTQVGLFVNALRRKLQR